MPKAFRLYPASAPGDPLSGEGARLFGGRWNRTGIAVVYTSEHLSLAALEVLANNPDWSALDDYRYLQLDFDKDLVLSLDPLPDGWRALPAAEASIAAGSLWATRKTSPVLAVPSVVIPTETNYILNPAHPALKQINIKGPFPFRFDIRLQAG